MTKRLGAAIGGAAAGLLALGAEAAGSRAVVQPPPRLANPEHADIVFEKFSFWSFRGSRLAARGRGDRLLYDREGGHGWVTAPNAEVLPAKPGDVLNHFTAGSATGVVATKIADASDHVTLSRLDGSARTESAHYEGDRHLITGTQPIDVLTGRFQVHGTSFQADTTTEVAQLEGPVEGDGRLKR